MLDRHLDFKHVFEEKKEHYILEIPSTDNGRGSCDIDACFQYLFNSNYIELPNGQSTRQVNCRTIAKIVTQNLRSMSQFPTEELVTSQLVPASVAAASVFSILAIFSYVSVVHMNPAVTFSLFLSGAFEAKLVAPYMLGSDDHFY